jgi:3-oxoadipate enol-lactonase
MHMIKTAPLLFSNQPAARADRSGYAMSCDGVPIYYECRGNGPPLLILNNFFMTASQWELFTRRIRQAFTVVTYDLRHQGRSGRVTERVALADHVKDLAALVDHLGYQSIFLLGSSVSTLICRDYALQRPDRVSKLIMVGPLFNPFGSLYRTLLHRSLLASLEAGGPEAVFDHYYPLLHSARAIENNRTAGYLALKIRFVENNPRQQLFQHLHSTLEIEDRSDLLKQLDPPTLLLCGEDDFLTNRDALETLCRLMPRARYELIEMAGHHPYVDATAEFEARVLAFLRATGEPVSVGSEPSTHAATAAAQ